MRCLTWESRFDQNRVVSPSLYMHGPGFGRAQRLLMGSSFASATVLCHGCDPIIMDHGTP
jgi:hypothetical protein